MDVASSCEQTSCLCNFLDNGEKSAPESLYIYMSIYIYICPYIYIYVHIVSMYIFIYIYVHACAQNRHMYM